MALRSSVGLADCDVVDFDRPRLMTMPGHLEPYEGGVEGSANDDEHVVNFRPAGSARELQPGRPEFGISGMSGESSRRFTEPSGTRCAAGGHARFSPNGVDQTRRSSRPWTTVAGRSPESCRGTLRR